MEDDGSDTIADFFHGLRTSWRCGATTLASEMLPHLTELLERNFESRLIGNIGPGMSLKVVKLLNWQLAWTEQGFEWQADTKHSRSVLLKHGLVEGKSTSAVSPGSKASGTNIRDGEDYLGEHEAKEYASAAGTLLYHALDRPDLQFTVGRLTSAITKPLREHRAMMKHCLRYLVGRRCCAWKFDYQEWQGEIVILTDADWASDNERRRSVDCVDIYHGGHLIEASTSTQQVVSLSTAESEFFGTVRGAASGIQLREAFMQFGFSVRLRVLSDSSAARATTARTGSGRVKHVEARYLWVQDRVRKKQFSVVCCDVHGGEIGCEE